MPTQNSDEYTNRKYIVFKNEKSLKKMGDYNTLISGGGSGCFRILVSKMDHIDTQIFYIYISSPCLIIMSISDSILVLVFLT